jgi:hypothetical protein
MLELRVTIPPNMVKKYRTFDGLKIVDSVFRVHLPQMHRVLEHYPPERPGQRYVRTGRLGAGWTERFNGPANMSLTNAVAYGPLVQDLNQQASIHRGRWTTAQDTLAVHHPLIIAGIHQAIAEWNNS